MRKRRGRGCVAWLVVLILGATAVAAAVYGPDLHRRFGDRVFSASTCTVTLGQDSHRLTVDQSNHAALIAAGSARRGLPARAATIALATAIQESGLRNIDWGDRDSVGLFQQRPSQGWGTVEQILDPHYATDKFYEELVTVAGWRDMAVTDAAQAVQRSAFPLAYERREAEARLWASALRGHSGPGAVSCSLRGDDAGSVAALDARLAADFGDGAYTVEVVDEQAQFTTVTVTPSLDSREAHDSLTAWAVAVASRTGLHAVAWSNGYWSRDDLQPDRWGAQDHQVTLVIRTAVG